MLFRTLPLCPLTWAIFRCLYLSRTYSVLKKYAESLALTSRAILHLREARPLLEEQTDTPARLFPLTSTDLDSLEREIASEESKSKKEWFAYNGGSTDASVTQNAKKPLFFDIAFNYVELPMERLEARAGKVPAVTAATAHPVASKEKEKEKEKEKKVAKVIPEEVPMQPVAKEAPASGGGALGGLLGGWWGRK